MSERVITGFHAIEERISSSDTQNASSFCVLYSKAGPRVKNILALATGMKVPCIQVSGAELDEKVRSLPEHARDHRGIVLCVSGDAEDESNIVSLDEWILENTEKDDDDSAAYDNASLSKTGRRKVTVLVLDSITDPHNVGAILRSCDQFGVSLVVLTETRSIRDVTRNETVSRASAGASAWVKVAVVKNLARAVEQLKRANFWVYAADADGENCTKFNFAERAVLIMGSEGSGISKLLSQQSDAIVSIPTCGKLDSLNVSVAAGVLLYELSTR